MLILAIETTGNIASAALAENGQIRSIRFSRREMNHMTELLPMIRDILSDAKLALDDLDALAVSAGPGSFTGMRIGISAVRALAQASGLPVIAVPTLETYVFHDKDFNGIICPVLDARLSQVYAGAYRLDPYADKPRLNVFVPGGAYKYEDFAERLQVAAGDVPYRIMPEEDYTRDASHTAAWAFAFGVPQDYKTIEPIYIRKAEAQRRLDAGLIQPKG